MTFDLTLEIIHSILKSVDYSGPVPTNNADIVRIIEFVNGVLDSQSGGPQFPSTCNGSYALGQGTLPVTGSSGGATGIPLNLDWLSFVFYHVLYQIALKYGSASMTEHLQP